MKPATQQRCGHLRDELCMVDEELSRAVLAYVGSPGRLGDRSPEDRVIDVVGERAGPDLAPCPRLLEDLNHADPPLWAAESVAEIGHRAEGWLGSRHPELSREASRALANQFAFDWKLAPKGIAAWADARPGVPPLAQRIRARSRRM